MEQRVKGKERDRGGQGRVSLTGAALNIFEHPAMKVKIGGCLGPTVRYEDVSGGMGRHTGRHPTCTGTQLCRERTGAGCFLQLRVGVG